MQQTTSNLDIPGGKTSWNLGEILHGFTYFLFCFVLLGACGLVDCGGISLVNFSFLSGCSFCNASCLCFFC